MVNFVGVRVIDDREAVVSIPDDLGVGKIRNGKFQSELKSKRSYTRL